MIPENLLQEWSRLFVTSLADAGITDVVVSPGSRSTPLVLAALSVARLRCHSVIDERSAAFFALGRSRMTGTPTALVCTSGSAAAHYLPAAVEATLSGVPLLLITADRPFELQDAGAAQTIDQIKFYGAHAKSFVELGMPDAADGSLRALRRATAKAVFDSVSGNPGPVHVNFRARKPLEPVTVTSDAGRDLVRRVDAILDAPIQRPVHADKFVPQAAIDELAAVCGRAERGIVVCGPLPPRAATWAPSLAVFAERTGFAVYAEGTSQLRFGGLERLSSDLCLDGLDGLLRAPAFRERFRPDLVVQVGAAPVSGAWDRFVGERPEIARHVIAEHGYPDPHGSARTLLFGDAKSTLDRLAAAVGFDRDGPRRRWCQILKTLNDAAWSAVDGTLASAKGLSEGAATRAVLGALPPGAVLGIGNSLPVRHLDAFCRANGPENSGKASIAVFSQRGASGIDGLVSGAAGAAEATGRPTCLVLGDVSALHDLGGFDVASKIDGTLVVVVLNNDGGRIFDNLPLANANVDPSALQFWTTPHGRTFEPLAPLFGLRYSRADSAKDVACAVEAGLGVRGCSVVEVPLPPNGARAEYDELDRRVRESVEPIAARLEA